MNTPTPLTSEKTDVSKGVPQKTKASTSAVTEFSPISSLFRMSFAKLKPVVKHLIGLEVIRMITMTAVIITFAIIVGVSVASSGILNNLDAVRDPMQLPGLMGTLFQTEVISSMVLVVIIAGMALTWLSLIFAAAFILRLDKSDQGIPFSQFLKDGLKISSTLFLLSLLLSAISLGATMIFLIPGLIASIVLSFAVYEVILHKTSITAALNNSYTIITTHFEPLFVRALVLLVAMVVINAFFDFLAGDKNNASSMFVQLIGTVVGAVTSWFSMAYAIIIYREARAQTNLDNPKRPTWLYIVSGLGWIVLLVLGSYLWSMRADIAESINSLISRSSSESYMQSIDGEYVPADLEYSDDPTSFPIDEMMQEDGELNQAEFDAWLQQYQEENQLTE